MEILAWLSEKEELAKLVLDTSPEEPSSSETEEVRGTVARISG